MTIHFHIPGQPVGKRTPAHRQGRRTCPHVHAGQTVSYESTVALFAAQAMAGARCLPAR